MSRRHLRLIASLSATVMLLAACETTPDEPEPGNPAGTAGPPVPPEDLPEAVRAFESCDELLNYHQTQATELLSYGGFHEVGGLGLRDADESLGADSADGEATPAPVDSIGQVSPVLAPENTDRPARAVTNDVALAVTDGEQVTVIGLETSEVLSSFDLPVAHRNARLLLHGSNLLILAPDRVDTLDEDRDNGMFRGARPTLTVLTHVDLANPAAPNIKGSLRLEGDHRGIRASNGTVHLVIEAGPSRLTLARPTSGVDRDTTLAENREVIAATSIDIWIPELELLDADGQSMHTGPMVECTDVSHPQEHGGVATLGVLTIDLTADDLAPVSATGLVATGGAVHISPTRLLVSDYSPRDAMGSQGPYRGPFTSRLHAFNVAEDTSTAYVASGDVEGRVHDGSEMYLEDEVITVVAYNGGADTEEASTVLNYIVDEGELVELGRSAPLGDGHTSQTVQFLGAGTLAVITAEHASTFHLVDISNPAAPELRGEVDHHGTVWRLISGGPEQVIGTGRNTAMTTAAQAGDQVTVFDLAGSTPDVSEASWQDGQGHATWRERGVVVDPDSGSILIAGSKLHPGNRYDVGVRVVTIGEEGVTEERMIDLTHGRSSASRPRGTVLTPGSLWVLTGEAVYRVDLDAQQAEHVTDLG